jgi:WXXGXW repeat (2 copies)
MLVEKELDNRNMRVIGFLIAVAFAAALPLATSAPASAQLYVGIGAPPILPVYQQPYLANPNYQWIPGYWGYGPGGYYWIPGTWMAAPQAGLLWTPGYWGYQNQNNYGWNPGYWGRTVGYYGGVNYGGGYYGNGFVGGGWYGNQFRYNTAVMRVNPRYVRNVYVNRTVVVHNVNRYSYYGPGGSRVTPTAAQVRYARETHVGLTPYQRQHITVAAGDRNMYARVNNGRPAELTVAKPFSATNRPPNYKPLTATDKAAAPKPPPNTAAKPPTAAKPAPKPPNTAAKPPANAAKPPAETKPAPKPPANSAAKPPAATHPAPKPPVHSAAKPPPMHAAHPAPKPAPVHAAPKPPPAAAKPPQNNGGGKPPQQNGQNGGGKPPR